MPKSIEPKTIRQLEQDAWAQDVLFRRMALGIANSQRLAGVHPVPLAERNRKLLERFLGMA